MPKEEEFKVELINMLIPINFVADAIKFVV